MEQNTILTHNSIISEGSDQWDKLDDTKALAQLRRKFWGEHMKDEETKRYGTQPEHKCMDVNVDETAEEDDEEETGSVVISSGLAFRV